MSFLSQGRYSTTPPAPAAGGTAEFQVDAQGNLKVAPASAEWSGIALASALYNSAASFPSADLPNTGARGLVILFDVTAFTAGGTSSTIQVQAKAGSDYATIYSLAPTVAGTGLLTMCVYPGAASAGSWSVAPVQGVIPHVFRLQLVTVGAVNYTATLSYNLIP